MSNLQALLSPRSIAILGASADLSKINGRTLGFLLEKGYRGRIYPVNPKYEQIAGLRCYPDVAALPEAPDLAVVAVPAAQVLATVKGLTQRGARAAVIFSSGFAEMGAAGRKLEHEVAAAARAAGLRLCGPNCLGLINAYDCIIATFGQFAEGPTPPGPVGFVTQSGAFGTAIAALARRRVLGLGYFINTGNECDVDFVQMMRAVLDDERITAGAGYVEGVRDGAGLKALAEHALALGKPLTLTKVGRTAAGAKAAASHTGALAGTDAVFDGVIRGLGVIRARNEEHMLDIVDVLSSCKLPTGRGLGILTQSGGAGVLMADRAEEAGLQVAELTPETRTALARVIPAFGTTGNPVDVTGQFVANPDLLYDSARIVMADPNVHVGIIWLQLMDAHADRLVEIFNKINSMVAKPWLVCWVAAPDAALAKMRAAGIVVLRGAEPAVDAVAALVRYAEARRNWLADQTARAAITLPALKLPAAAGAVDSITGQALLQSFGVQTAAARLASTVDEAVTAAQALGYPVVMKIESPDILHKTEAQGVALNLKDEAAVRAAYQTLTANAGRYKADARIAGVLVQAMAQGDVELVIGLKRDSTFGPVVMVGLGGVLIEVFKDVVFRAAPVTEAEALRMLDELKSRVMLDGVRGRPPVDKAALARMISAVSCFGAAAGPRLAELDLNPVLAGPKGVVAVDWLMQLE
ncbi:MAG: acetate--CoA ligase family protein [Betaproteobacteria bacterium]|nr:acetate--CoA ligase family protein [Betaproteobacteria bacterium]